MTVLSGRKQLLLWIVAALFATAGLAFILIRERHTAPARHALYIVGNARNGRALFFGKKNCYVCHSINGEGGRIAPDLADTPPGSPAMGWLATALWNHAPGMFRRIRTGKSYPQLDWQEMADILAYLYQASTADRPGDPVAGQKVFVGKGCSHCHSVRSSGGKSAPELSSPDGVNANQWTHAMWNHVQSMMAPVTQALGQWPQFMGSDMSDLIAYVNEGAAKKSEEPAGEADRGWKVFQARCMQCHSVRGNGGKAGPELGPEHDLPLTTAQFASVLWNHAPAMLQLGREKGMQPPALSGTEMADLVAFLAGLRYFEPSGSALLGQRIFQERGCARCHGDSAQGTPLGPPIEATGEVYTSVSFITSLWKHGPKMVDRTEQLGLAWPTLGPTDVGDLVSFLNEPRH